MTDMDIDEELTATSLRNHNIDGESEVEAGVGDVAGSDTYNLDPLLPQFDCYENPDFEYVEVKQEEEENALNRVSIAAVPHPIQHPIQHPIHLMQQPMCADVDPMNTHNQWREETQTEDFDDDVDTTRQGFIRSTSFFSPTPILTRNIHNPIRRTSQSSNLLPTPPGEEEEEWTRYSEGINSTAREWDAQSDVNTVEHFRTDLPASVQWSPVGAFYFYNDDNIQSTPFETPIPTSTATGYPIAYHYIPPIQALLDESKDPLLKLFYSLENLPTALSISNSAHVCHELTSIINTLGTPDATAVGEGVKKLSVELNKGADAITDLLTDGFFSGRKIVRGLTVLVGDVDAVKRWNTRVDKFAGEMDQVLHHLEDTIASTVSQMGTVKRVWEHVHWETVQGHESAKHGYKEREVELEKLKGESRVTKMLKMWSSNSNASKRALHELQADVNVLSDVVNKLKEMGPGISALGQRVKEIRAGVQRFRGELKAEKIMSECDATSCAGLNVEKMKLTVGALEDALPA
ncbi:hypothetical protein BCR33DRAFT_716873 [Rhizoclosmatium globosum]|uniref:Uncharacterized protein n=1 Tax=Rhizoclosmatium globosum TaxID=329046 RepID=A0A1Y2CB92_9FUNG|nr:hypothetical protein BCR33DRAFT_716873 [Rhizoclosmatium globosum]|eukprot:ORY44302.1 hypothetical protein BCR33DRAFT_716873 [Rhizoclosmatium globosum]